MEETKVIKCLDLIKKICVYFLEQNKQHDFILISDGCGVVEASDDDIFLNILDYLYSIVYLIEGNINLDIVEKDEWHKILLQEMSEELRENAKVVEVNNTQLAFIEYED